MLLQCAEDLLHQINNRREVELERNIEEPAEERDCEEGDESHDQTDDRVADRVYGLANFIFIACRENEGNTADDNEDETEDRRGDESKCDEGGNDVDDTAFFK